MKLFLQFTLILLYLFGNYGCQNDGDSTNAYKKIDVSTGLEITNTNGDPLGTWGYRNESAVNISLYPNPCKSSVKVYSQIGNIKKVWLLPATCHEADAFTSIYQETQNLSYSPEDIKAKASHVFEVNDKQLEINLWDKPLGDYRVFLEMKDGEIYWKNVKKIELNHDFTTADMEHFCM